MTLPEEQVDNGETSRGNESEGQNKVRKGPFVVTFIIMFTMWIVFSGKFDAVHLSMGALCSALVAFFSSDLLFPETDFSRIPGLWWGFLKYFPWLIYQIVLANLHVMRIVLHPRMMDKIDPRIITFKSRLKDEVARVTFANSITLTPGTITVSVSQYGNYSVHALDKASAEPLPGDMEARVGEIFGE